MSPLNITQPLDSIRYMVYNGYYKVMSNIPKMGHLTTPENRLLENPLQKFWSFQPGRLGRPEQRGDFRSGDCWWEMSHAHGVVMLNFWMLEHIFWQIPLGKTWIGNQV